MDPIPKDRWVCNPIKGQSHPLGCSVYDPKKAPELGPHPKLFHSLNSCLLSDCPGAVVPHGYACDTSFDYCRATDGPGPSLLTCENSCTNATQSTMSRIELSSQQRSPCLQVCSEVLCASASRADCPQYCNLVCAKPAV